MRIGNGAFDQRQNDVFGAVLDSILLHTRHSQRLPRRLWPIVQSQAECATGLAGARPGIWEAREPPQHYVSSSSCAGWRSTGPRSSRRSAETPSRRRSGRRRRTRSGPTSSSTASTTVESCASTTRPTPRRVRPARGDLRFLPGDDERLAATVNAIADELTEDGFVLRYRTDETDDGLSGKEGTFLICSFWLVSAGDRRRAAAGARPDGAPAANFVAARALCRGVRRRDGPTPRKLPAGVLAPGADRGGGANHRPRVAGGVLTMDSYDVIIIGTARAAAPSPGTSRPPGSASCCSSAGTGFPASLRTGTRPTSSSTTGTSRRTPGTTRGASFQPQIHYFRAGDQALRRSALPAPQGGLRRAPPPRRRLARLADRVRRARAVLHAGRAPLRGPRRPRRGPDRAAGQCAVPLSSGLPRAADPAALRRPRRRRTPPVPCALRDPAERGEHAVQPLRPLRDLRRVPVSRPCEVRRRGARRAQRPSIPTSPLLRTPRTARDR